MNKQTRKQMQQMYSQTVVFFYMLFGTWGFVSLDSGTTNQFKLHTMDDKAARKSSYFRL